MTENNLYSRWIYRILSPSIIFIISIFLLFLSVATPSAQATTQPFLPAEQAFVFKATSLDQHHIELHWQIADGYYMYQQKFAVKQQQHDIQLQLPPALEKQDVYFGKTQVYKHQVKFNITSQPNQSYQIFAQGCAEKGLCYPITQYTVKTDQHGLVIDEDLNQNKTSLNNNTQKNLFQSNTSSNTINPSIIHSQDNNPNNITQNAIASAKTSTTPVAEDQHWANRLQQQSLWLNILLFLGLGCLLAFTPCSLPMLPILSNLLLRKHIGIKAWSISLSFVLSMASVYAVLGLVAASAGNNFQRWLQQPVILIIFSLVFVLFALNLFGLFELKLPHRLANRLDQLQARQQGGTLLGAVFMGILSALLVGPCMTAPLAGTLLYISQTQNIWSGAILLFSLGFGIGIPLLLLTIIGEKALPKPGQWMNIIRHIFAFIMLGLSLYFLRQLLTPILFNLLLFILILGFMVYLIILIKAIKHRIRYLLIIFTAILPIIVFWQIKTTWQYQQQSPLHWQTVQTAAQLEQALQQAKHQQHAVIIDVYADWCVACQPIEHNVWNTPQVQQQLKGISMIKIDLTHYHASQKDLLQQWQMLGPPTVLFLQTNGQEQRDLRLTGEFSQKDFLIQLQQLKSHTP